MSHDSRAVQTESQPKELHTLVIFAVDMDDLRVMVTDRRLIVICIGANDDQVAGFDKMRCRTVDTNRSTPRRSADRVSDQSVPIVDVINMDLLMLHDIRGNHQFVIDGDTSFIVELGVGDSSTVDF